MESKEVAGGAGDTMTKTTRRALLKTAATTAGALMAGLPAGWVGAAYADDSPETPAIRFGMIALTDLLKARALNLEAEQRRERVFGAHIALPFGERRRKEQQRAQVE